MSILTQVKTLLAKREAWTQNSNARAVDRSPVCYFQPEAVCWCVNGALAKITEDTNHYIGAITLLDKIAREMGYDSAVHLNDTADWEKVHELLDKAVIRDGGMAS